MYKYSTAGLKRLFYQKLDSMLDVALGGLLQVNRGTAANKPIVNIYDKCNTQERKANIWDEENLKIQYERVE